MLASSGHSDHGHHSEERRSNGFKRTSPLLFRKKRSVKSPVGSTTTTFSFLLASWLRSCLRQFVFPLPVPPVMRRCCVSVPLTMGTPPILIGEADLERSNQALTNFEDLIFLPDRWRSLLLKTP